MNPTVNAKTAVAFVTRRGMVLESGRGPISSLAEAVAGEPVRGSWWGHDKSHEIFAATRAVRASPEVLVCRLVQGKVTYVHRRLWPALARLAHKIGKGRLAAIREEHTASGAHRVTSTPFVRWVPAEIFKTAKQLSEEEARSQLGACLGE